VLGLRTQVEVLGDPIKLDFSILGNPCWSVLFQTYHEGVYDTDAGKLTALYSDCENVPMLKTPETAHLSGFLSTSSIFFEEI